SFYFLYQAEDGIRDPTVTGVQTCSLPISQLYPSSLGASARFTVLSTVGTPTPQVSETTVKRAEAPRLLEYSWGGNDLRWELEPRSGERRVGREFGSSGLGTSHHRIATSAK